MDTSANPSPANATPPERASRVLIHVRRLLVASADDTWRIISTGKHVERWFEWVAETVVTRATEGGLRVIRMKDGTSFDEHITINDARTQTFQYYAPYPPLPVKHVIGTKRIESAADGTSHLSWSVTFEPKTAAAHDLTQTMRELYESALAKIDDCAFWI